MTTNHDPRAPREAAEDGQPDWYAERHGRVAAQFAALAAARIPDPKPLAPVDSLAAHRAIRAVEVIRAMSAKKEA